MGDTSISWTDKTWNCVRGCSRVSEGCRNCYAERQAMRFAGPGGAYEGLVTKRLKVLNADEPDKGNYVEAHWTGKVVFDLDHLADPLHWKKPCRVFVNSMSDLFHESLDNDQIAAVFGIMAAAKQHTHQALTKRADRMGAWFAWLDDVARHCNGGVGMTPAAYCFATAQRMLLERDPVFNLDGTPTRPVIKRGDVVDAGLTAAWPLPNVWLGVSVENQKAADERIPPLLRTPAAVHFLSCEPLLGPVDLKNVDYGGITVNALTGYRSVVLRHVKMSAKLDWVIAGAESGPRARHCDPDWLRALRDQCANTDLGRTAFFLKQAVQRQGAYTECVLRPIPAVLGRIGELVPIVAIGDGSKEKSRGVIERPYLDGRQHLEFPR